MTAEQTPSQIPQDAGAPAQASPAVSATEAPPSEQTITLEAVGLPEARARAAQQWGVSPGEVQLSIVGRPRRGGTGGELLFNVRANRRAAPGTGEAPAETYCYLGELLLVVPAAAGNGKSIEPATVAKVLADWPLDARDDQAVSEAIRLADGRPRPVGSIRPSVPAAESSPFAVKLTDDALYAWLIPWGDSSFRAPTPQAVRQALAAAGVRQGLDNEAIEDACRRPHDRPLPVAAGQKLEPGVDARLEYLCEGLDPGSTRRAHAAVAGIPAGAVVVEAGQGLARKVPATPTRPGWTVKGDALTAADGKDLSLAGMAGPGTSLSEDGTEVTASIGGFASFDGRQFAVKDPAVARREARRSPNGYFELRTQRGVLYLLVDAPTAGRGKPVELDAVRHALAAWPLEEQQVALVSQAVADAAWKPVPVGRIEPHNQPSDDAPFAIKVDAHRDVAVLLPWAEPEAPPVAAEAVREALRAAGVTYGVEEEAIEGATRKPWSGPVVVARLDRVPLQVATVDEARAQAAALMGVPPETIEVTIERTEKLGFLGLGGQRLHVIARYVRPITSVDGHFELHWARGQLLLTVWPAQGEGEAVAVNAVEVALANAPLDQTQPEGLETAVREARGTRVSIGQFLPTGTPAADEPVAVRISDDHLAAYLVPWALEAGAALDLDVARQALAAAGVTHGIDESTLSRLGRDIFTEPTIVAHGTSPQHGKDAKIEWLVDPARNVEGPRAPRVLEDGRLDYRDLGGMATVPAEAVLATKTPATPGEAGHSVLGEELPPTPGADISLAGFAATNTAVSEDDLVLKATAAGLVTKLEDKVAVMPVQTVDGDVDFTLGNVHFEGSLMIKGGVKPGFRVTAAGAIQISGNVESAVVEAGGDLRVSGGITGAPGSTIKAGGSMRAKYMQSAHAQARGQIAVDSEIWQCTVDCEDVVEVKGRIVGGILRSRKGVIVQTLGSSTGTHTRLEVARGEAPTAEELAAPGYRPPAVVVRQTVHPGVTLRIRGAELDVDMELPATTFREQNGEIVTSAPAIGRG